ncbi:class I SAM-dependent methyltransferase [Hwanghaeella sp.]|uniref:class I SAM-dependent methyltransferase n=1 Tax=Hwanghaeella sp. TaxID=2605943 RepID=UPI003CCB7439
MERLAREFFDGDYFEVFAEKAYPTDGAATDTYPFFPIRRDRVHELCSGLTPKHVVDIGCGGGHLVEPFLQAGSAATCVDFSPRMLTWCGRRLKGHAGSKGNLRFVEACASDLSGLDDDCADLVLCVGPLEYCSDDEAKSILAECARITRPGGTLISAHLNMLFDLFTLDKFTVEFYRRALAPNFELSDEKLAWVTDRMRSRLSIPTGEEKTESIRETVKTRTDNPLTVNDGFKPFGFTVDTLKFTRFFAAPPFCGNEDTAIAQHTIGIEKELSETWVGYVAASSYLVKATKVG